MRARGAGGGRTLPFLRSGRRLWHPAPDSPPPSGRVTEAARLLPALLALAVLAYALLAAWILAPGGLGASPAADRLYLGPLHLDLSILALAPVALSAACSWLLVREMRARAEALRRANAVAADSARAKAVALGAMGHEMRNSLSAMAGFSDLLGGTQLTPAQAEHLASIQDGTAHLLAVVDSLLEHGRMEAGRVVFRQADFEVDALVRACLRAVTLTAARKDIPIVFHGAGTVGHVTGDATRIRQVLLNLLSNAVKFTPRGTVAVTASASAEHGGQLLRLEVRDTGIGIQPRDLDRLFVPFSQLGAPGQAGTGLGLAISRQLCRRMGGDLTVESRPGKGSTFTATFRVHPAAGTAPNLVTLERTVAPAPPAPRGLHVLLAEDNVMNQRLALKALEALGHTATVVTDGAQAVGMASRWRYDAVLMDVHMPVMDGLEATRTLHRTLAQRPFIIGLTADALPEDREACLRAGMDAHLAKPVDRQLLESLLETARQRAARREPVGGRAAPAAPPPQGVVASAGAARASSAHGSAP